MTGGKLPDGGILYDGTEEDDDIVSEGEVSRPAVSVDWSLTNVNEIGRASCRERV